MLEWQQHLLLTQCKQDIKIIRVCLQTTTFGSWFHVYPKIFQVCQYRLGFFVLFFSLDFQDHASLQQHFSEDNVREPADAGKTFVSQRVCVFLLLWTWLVFELFQFLLPAPTSFAFALLCPLLKLYPIFARFSFMKNSYKWQVIMHSDHGTPNPLSACERQWNFKPQKACKILCEPLSFSSGFNSNLLWLNFI